jgi:PAS domain S-box-containing protein
MAEPQKKSGITRVELFIYLVLVLLGGAAVMLADLQAEKKKFLNYSDLVYQEVSQRLLTSEGVVNALAQFGQHSHIDGEEHDNVLDGLALTYPHIHAIAKFDYVRHRDRLSYEKDMRENPGGNTEIREYDNQSGVIRARKRNAYLVARVVTPLEPANAQLLGLNLLNDEEIGQAVANSMESRTMSIARVPEYLSLQPTVIMLKNTYFGRLQPRTTSEGKRQINGAVMLFLDIDIMIARVSEKFPDIDFELQVNGFNLTAPAQSEIYPAHSSTTKVLPTTVSFSDTRHFNLGNRDLSLKISSQYKPGIIQMMIAAVVMLLIAFATRLWSNVRKQQLVAAEKQEEAFQALYSERERAEVTLSSIGDAVITTDDRNHVTFLNPVAETLTGTTNDRAFDKPINQVIQLVDEENDETITDPMEHCSRRASENPDMTTHLLQQANGEEALSVDISCSKLKDIQGEEIGSVIVIRDVSHERELKKQLTYQASHDPLTGLVNRTRFEEDVREAISSCDESGIGHALCYMDLDQFKIVNDTCGHMAGDALLKQLSQILAKRVRDSDVLARLGGDEFGLLLRNCDLENAVPIADTALPCASSYSAGTNVPLMSG